MGSTSDIEWTDASWTPIRARNRSTGKIGWHCEHATTGCEFCYAEGMNKRLGTGLAFKPGHRKDIDIFLDETMLLAPLRWKKPRMIFLCSMTDAFAEFVTDEWLDKMFAVMALCPQHTFQVLTKRADRMLRYFAKPHRANWASVVTKFVAEGRCGKNDWTPALATEAIFYTRALPNVWLGISAERQQEADERIPLLLQTPAAVRFVSAEPLLGPVDLRARRLDWVIVGGESGPDARPMHPDWARSLARQCAAAGVAFFFKQWGEHQPLAPESNPPHLLELRGILTDRHQRAHGYAFLRVGKKRAGRLLDGREYNEFPKVSA